MRNKSTSFASFCGVVLAAIANGGGTEVSPLLIVFCLFAGIVALTVTCAAIYMLVHLTGGGSTERERRRLNHA